MLLRRKTHLSPFFGCCDLTAQSASVILDKFRCFPTTPSLAENCEALAQRAECPTDQYLPHIVGSLRIIEEVDALAKNTAAKKRDENLTARISHLQSQWRSLKESMPPHAASSRE